ncbi:cache domain-containing protein [Dyadobacter sp. 3J3]|uniref:cache domain-containing protein n=1 Tax=Dyadobacter sp. 3J3 TaxID=2606600 RepID=UPI00135B0DAC|nr:cache domain-containing protein [Dyadobacter sp. 3J3]
MERDSGQFSLSSFFSFDRKQAIVLSTILFILVAGALYSFVYIPSNRRNVDALRSRALQNIDKNIHNKIDNSVVLMNVILDVKNNSYPDRYSFQDKDRLQTYVKSIPRKDFKLDSISKTPLIDPNTQDSLRQVKFTGNNVQIILQKHLISLKMDYSFHQFIKPLLPDEIFDQYLLLDTRGEIIYQTFPSGVIEVISDSLLTKRTPFLQKSVRDIRLSGTDYKMFLQQVRLDYNSSVTIAGLLEKNKYQHLNTSLPETLVLFIFFIVITTILSLPWIKLYHMGNKDRLTVFDGLFAFVTSMLLMAFLVFGFVNYNGSMRPGDNPSTISKKNLGDGLKAAFELEIRSAYKALIQVDLARKNFKVERNISNVSSSMAYQWEKNVEVKQIDKAFCKEIQGSLAGINVSEIFWLDKDGGEVQNFNSTESAPAASYANRNYFKQLKSNKPFYLDSKKSQKIGIEQVISWTTGSFITVVSIPLPERDHSSASYAAIAFNPKSMNKPLLPAGFTYAIVDDAGSVLYHSDPSKNLNENLLDEFSESDKLSNAFLDNEETSFRTKYGGHEFDVYLSQFTNLPYHMVIFEDKAFSSIRDIKIFIFTFSLLLLFFTFLAVQFLIVYLFFQRPSFFKKHYFDISWLGPDRNLKYQYLQVIGFNLFIIIILFFVSFITTFLQFLFFLLVSSTAVTIFLNKQYKKRYFDIDEEKFIQKEKSVKALWIVVVLVNLAAFFAINFWYFIGYEVFILIVAIEYTRYFGDDENVEILDWVALKLSVSNSFALMVFTRLIIISAVPVVFLFTSAYNYESRLISIDRHNQFIKDQLDLSNGKKTPVENVNMFYDGIWVRHQAKIDFESVKYDDFTKWIFQHLTYYNASDPAKSYHKYQKGAIHLFGNGITLTNYSKPEGGKIKLATADINYKFPIRYDRSEAWRGFSYWLLALGALSLFFFLLHRIIRKLFALNLPSQTGWDKIDNQLLFNNNMNFRLFIIGLPGSSILDTVKKNIRKGLLLGVNGEALFFDRKDPWLNNTYIVDMLLIPDKEGETDDPAWKAVTDRALKGKYAMVIIDHFEYDLNNYNTNRIKLNFLEGLRQRKDCKIIIVSTVHPVNFLDSLNQDESRKPLGERQPEHDLNRWHVLLCHFRIMIKKIVAFEYPLDQESGWEKSLKIETNYGKFFHEMRLPVTNTLSELSEKELHGLKGDPLAFKLEITGHYYYMGLWQSLTKEEKFLLYDLAEDGLVNPYDDYNLSLLISKGLIIQADSGLRLFNKGFRNFILTSIGATEAMKIRNQIRDNGTWNSLRIPLILLIVAVFAFLFASQQEAYETVLKYLSVLTISVPAALKFFSMFEKTPKNN